MRRMLAVLLVVTCVVALTPPAAHAGGHGAARVAIGLATFAIFAPSIIVGEILARAVPPYQAPAVVVAPPPAYSAPPAYVRQTYAAPAPAQPKVIQYPHGRYELRGDGIATAYQWAWIPNPTIPSPPPGAPPAYSVPAYSAPAPSYSAPSAYVRQTNAAPAPAQPTVFQYPHGQYELRGDGIATAYQWVWIPNPTIPSPPPSAPPAPPAASQ